MTPFSIIPLAIHDTVNPINAVIGLKPKRVRVHGMQLISWQLDNPAVAPVQFMQLCIENTTGLSYNLGHNMHPGYVAVPYQTATMWAGQPITIPLSGDIDILESIRITVYREGAVPVAVVPAANYAVSLLFYLTASNYDGEPISNI